MLDRRRAIFDRQRARLDWLRRHCTAERSCGGLTALSAEQRRGTEELRPGDGPVVVRIDRL